MWRALLLTLIFVSRCSATCNWDRGLLKNRYLNGEELGYVDGVYDGNLGLRDTISINTVNQMFVNLGSNSLTLKIWDTGAVCIGACSATFADLRVTDKTTLSQAFLAAFRTITTNFNYQMEFEYKHILSSEQADTGLSVGNDDCYLETVEFRLFPYAGLKKVKEMVVITWHHYNIDRVKHMYFQVALAYTDDGMTYALMYIHDSVDFTSFEGTLFTYVNGFYTSAASRVYTDVCSTNIRSEILTMSNHYCGQPGEIVYDLTNPCDASSPNCGNLQPDPEDRPLNCRNLITPADSCYVHGHCFRTQGDFVFSFVFSKERFTYQNFELLNTTTLLRQGAGCVVGDVTETADSFNVTFTVSSDVLNDCDVIETDGLYEFTFYNFDGTYAIHGDSTRVVKVTCNPDDLPKNNTATIDVGDIESTTVNAGDGGSLSASLGNMADRTSTNFYQYTDGDKVIVGKYLYPFIQYQPTDNYIENVYPYGVYVDSCQISNTADFSDQLVDGIVDRCPIQGPAQFFKGFKNIDSPVTFGSLFTLRGGPFRVIKFSESDSIWLRCRVKFCTTTDYTNSYCYNSCEGQGTNSFGDRKRREAAEDDAVLVTAHLKVIDTDQTESRLSCVDETLAYVVFTALTIVILIAAAVTVMLFIKVRDRKRK